MFFISYSIFVFKITVRLIALIKIDTSIFLNLSKQHVSCIILSIGTGALSELQIAFVCRESLRVR